VRLTKKRKLLLTQLTETLSVLDRSVDALQYSYAKCSAIKDPKEHSHRDQERFEALTSRFARTADILTQKALKTMFALIQENPKTFLDAANLLEKIEIIENAENILNIRELRNQIAHEYVVDDLQALYSDVLQFVPELEKVIANVKHYINKTL
jgi:uncharacterized protein YutE (UPF0331/DUF86 family)